MRSEAKHTEGRLRAKHTSRHLKGRYLPPTLIDCLGDQVATVNGHGKFAVVNACNADRLAACWNACEGLRDPEALRRERDEATALLRQSVDLISAGVLASVFGGEMTAQAEERINRLVDDLRAFLAKTKGEAS